MLLNGRMQVIPADLAVLGYVATFRIPEELNRNLPQVLAQVIQLPRWPPPRLPLPRGGSGRLECLTRRGRHRHFSVRPCLSCPPRQTKGFP
jgi:hypothetical protein